MAQQRSLDRPLQLGHLPRSRRISPLEFLGGGSGRPRESPKRRTAWFHRDRRGAQFREQLPDDLGIFWPPGRVSARLEFVLSYFKHDDVGPGLPDDLIERSEVEAGLPFMQPMQGPDDKNLVPFSRSRRETWKKAAHCGDYRQKNPFSKQLAPPGGVDREAPLIEVAPLSSRLRQAGSLVRQAGFLVRQLCHDGCTITAAQPDFGAAFQPQHGIASPKAAYLSDEGEPDDGSAVHAREGEQLYADVGKLLELLGLDTTAAPRARNVVSPWYVLWQGERALEELEQAGLSALVDFYIPAAAAHLRDGHDEQSAWELDFVEGKQDGQYDPWTMDRKVTERDLEISSLRYPDIRRQLAQGVFLQENEARREAEVRDFAVRLARSSDLRLSLRSLGEPIPEPPASLVGDQLTGGTSEMSDPNTGCIARAIEACDEAALPMTNESNGAGARSAGPAHADPASPLRCNEMRDELPRTTCAVARITTASNANEALIEFALPSRFSEADAEKLRQYADGWMKLDDGWKLRLSSAALGFETEGLADEILDKIASARDWEGTTPLRYFVEAARVGGIDAGWQAYRAAAVHYTALQIATGEQQWCVDARRHLGMN